MFVIEDSGLQDLNLQMTMDLKTQLKYFSHQTLYQEVLLYLWPHT